MAKSKIDTKKVLLAVGGLVAILLLFNFAFGKPTTPDNLTTGVLDGMEVQIISDTGQVMSTIQVLPKSNPLSIIANLGASQVTLDTYLNPSMGTYFFKVVSKATPNFSKSSETAAARIEYTIKWTSVTYNNVAYASVFNGARLAQSTTAIVLPYNAYSTTAPAVSGQQIAFSDALQFILIQISRTLPAPPGGTTYNIVAKCTITATLYIDDAQMNQISQDATLTIGITNTAATGALTTMSISLEATAPAVTFY